MYRQTTVLLLVLCFALSGCGRRGALEAPGEPESAAISDEAPRPGSEPLSADVSPGATEPPPAASAAAPERRFFLDPLI